MKTIAKIVLSLILGLTSWNLSAFSGPLVSVNYTQAKTFKLSLEKSNDQFFQIQLESQEGTILFEEELKNFPVQGKSYNLKNLPAGEYSLRIEGSSQVFFQPLTIKNSTLQIDTKASRTLYKPTIVIRDAKVDLNFLQLENTNTTIELRNQLGEVVYSQVIKDTGGLCRRFDIAALEEGKYMFVVKTKDLIHYTSFYKPGPQII